MSDLIDRQAAIYIASGYCHPANIAEELRKLPSVQPERKKGKWINEGIYGEGHSQCSIRCSNPLCNFHYIGYLDDYNYCPNCGADMRGTE